MYLKGGLLLLTILKFSYLFSLLVKVGFCCSHFSLEFTVQISNTALLFFLFSSFLILEFQPFLIIFRTDFQFAHLGSEIVSNIVEFFLLQKVHILVIWGATVNESF